VIEVRRDEHHYVFGVPSATRQYLHCQQMLRRCGGDPQSGVVNIHWRSRGWLARSATNEERPSSFATAPRLFDHDTVRPEDSGTRSRSHPNRAGPPSSVMPFQPLLCDKPATSPKRCQGVDDPHQPSPPDCRTEPRGTAAVRNREWTARRHGGGAVDHAWPRRPESGSGGQVPGP
jgi:hypothetical protein